MITVDATDSGSHSLWEMRRKEKLSFFGLRKCGLLRHKVPWLVCFGCPRFSIALNRAPLPEGTYVGSVPLIGWYD